MLLTKRKVLSKEIDLVSFGLFFLSCMDQSDVVYII